MTAVADSIQGNVHYKDRSCQPAGLVPTLEGATVIADRDDELERSKIDSNGNYKLEFEDGSGPAKAWVRLQTDAVSVRPDDDEDSYMLPLGKIRPGDENADLLRRATPAGAANIFSVISRGAAAAKGLSPVKVPRVKVVWPAAQTGYSKGKTRIGVEDDDQWVPGTLLHEYGHHLLSFVADPSSPGGVHTATGTYPQRPAVALDEGFGDAFAHVVLDNPVVQYPTCSDIEDVGQVPATSTAGDVDRPRLAQYNEVRAAGVFWHLAEYLGARTQQDVSEGLRQILSALHSTRFNGGHPDSMRQVRDALINAHLETDKAQHDEIDSVFESQGMGWGVEVTVMFDDPRGAGTGAWYENHIVLKPTTGYGGGIACEETGNDGSLIGEDDSPPAQLEGGDRWYGTIGLMGDLSYTWHDDCLAAGGDGKVSQDSDSTILNSLLWFRFPYVSDSGHLLGRYDLTARYVCANNHPEDTDDPVEVAYYTCTNDRRVKVTVLNGVADEVTSTITLPRDQDTPILEFEGNGHCELADGTDCSV
jgi:hypothetical protein